MAVKAFLFDLDGVLWFSVDAHRLAFQKALHLMGFRWNFPKKTFGPYSGFTTEKALERVLEDKEEIWTAKQQHRFHQLKRQWALRFLMTQTRLHPRLITTLKKLHQTHKIALVSSAHPDSVKLFLKRSKTKRLFDVVVHSGHVPQSKPDPRIYKEAMRRLKIRPEEGVAIEDSISGAQAALRAGLRVIGMKGTIPPRKLRKTGAFVTVSRLTDILPYAIRL